MNNEFDNHTHGTILLPAGRIIMLASRAGPAKSKVQPMPQCESPPPNAARMKWEVSSECKWSWACSKALGRNAKKRRPSRKQAGMTNFRCLR